jgi:serine/threonine protein kinase
MSGIFKKNDKILSEYSGRHIIINDLVGAGGQGEVYEVTIDNTIFALKWYYSNSATSSQMNILKRIVELGPPNHRFLWPIEIVTNSSVKDFGYIMPFRDARFKGIVDILKRNVPVSFKTVIIACFYLSDSFFQLHAKGLCYKDISYNNILFDPYNGDVFIIDNDNVTIDDNSPSGIGGTPGFMAPEIVLGKAYPSTSSDLYSLAVLLFHMLFLSHPLDGEKELKIKCKDYAAFVKLYGKEPIFIFDPNDNSNRPVSGEHDNAIIFWNIYPQFLKDLFIKSFTLGIKDSNHGRVMEVEWRFALIKLMDSVFKCTECGCDNFYDLQYLKTANKLPICWSCQKETGLPFRIKLNNNIILLSNGSSLFYHHVENNYDLLSIIGTVVEHPTNKNVIGLKNLSNKKWTVNIDGNIQDVESGKSVTLKNGIKINFGPVEGEVRF